MSQAIDMSGRQFGFWIVKQYAGKSKWLCQCSCGTVKIVNGQSLRRGTSVSCGCKVRIDWDSRDIKEAFNQNVSVKHDSECWPWIASCTSRGYGQFCFKRRRYLTHMLAWELKFGRIPEGMHVCHSCDNPKCCNPSHLFLGTNLDNIADKVRKGRQAKGESVRKGLANYRGESVVQSKLTNEQVMDIRRRDLNGESPKEIASIYSINETTVGSVISGKQWAHLPILRTDSERTFRACPKCNAKVSTRGGLFYKHVKTCN